MFSTGGYEFPPQNWNQENTGFTISRDDQVAYNIWFALLVSAENIQEP